MIIPIPPIRTIFGAVGDFLKAVPSGVWVALIAVALLLLVDHRAYQRGYDASEAKHATDARKAAESARKADGEARGTVDQTNREVEQGNEDARNAAKDSDDPLARGLDSLRGAGTSSASPSR